MHTPLRLLHCESGEMDHLLSLSGPMPPGFNPTFVTRRTCWLLAFVLMIHFVRFLSILTLVYIKGYQPKSNSRPKQVVPLFAEHRSPAETRSKQHKILFPLPKPAAISQRIIIHLKGYSPNAPCQTQSHETISYLASRHLSSALFNMRGLR